MEIIKTGTKAQLRVDHGVHEVLFLVMTASGVAQKRILFDTADLAESFFNDYETAIMSTNGYELHQTADC